MLGIPLIKGIATTELAVISADSFATPALITRARPETRKKFFEFFTVPIRNANTRAAYYRAIQQFLAWVERAGYQDLEDIEPITVAAYIETLQRQAAHPRSSSTWRPSGCCFLADRKRSPGHESGPGSQDREVFTHRRQNTGIRRW